MDIRRDELGERGYNGPKPRSQLVDYFNNISQKLTQKDDNPQYLRHYSSAANPIDFNCKNFNRNRGLTSNDKIEKIFRDVPRLKFLATLCLGIGLGAGAIIYLDRGREAKVDGLEEVIRKEVKLTNELKAEAREKDVTISALKNLLEQGGREANLPLPQDPQRLSPDLQNGGGRSAWKNSAVEDQIGQQ